MPEVVLAMRDGRLSADGTVLTPDGQVRVTKIAIEPCGICRGGATFRHQRHGFAAWPI